MRGFRSSRMMSIAALVFLAAPGLSAAATGATPSAKANSHGLTVFAVITNDPEWRTKTTQDPYHVTDLATVETLYAGDKAVMAVYVSGARIKAGIAHLTCQLNVHDDTTGKTTKLPRKDCFEGDVESPQTGLYLTNMQFELGEDATGKAGLVRLDVQVTDENAHWTVPVEVSVRLDPSAGAK
jgi:hypothetical protein